MPTYYVNMASNPININKNFFINFSTKFGFIGEKN